MPKHIQGRAPPKSVKSARPLRVSIWRAATACRERRSGAYPIRRHRATRLGGAPLLVVPASAARLAGCETEPAANSLKGLYVRLSP